MKRSEMAGAPSSSRTVSALRSSSLLPGSSPQFPWRRSCPPFCLSDRDNQRLLNGVGAQNDRGHLLRFLEQQDVGATNNRAERDLRPAVIARKVSHCSKNERDARAFEAFTSVLQTLRKISPCSAATLLARLIDPKLAVT
jgi:hypothetical protein